MDDRDENDELDEDRELTAQPKRTEPEWTGGRRGDADLAVDPDELGQHFLREAVEQSELPSVTDPEPDELLLSGSAITDSVTDADYAGARTEWEAMVERLSEMQVGRGPDQGPRTPRIQTEDRHRRRTAGGSAIVLGQPKPHSNWGRIRMLIPIACASFAIALAWRFIGKRSTG